jgi:CRP-like cAMP-binding protein
MKKIIGEHADIRTHLTRYALAFYNQAAHTALSNASSAIPRRIARWLLMMRDRWPGDEIPLTHDIVADMLDIGRPGVTVALKELENQALIEMDRGHTTIRNREGLELLASDFYGLPEMEYQRLMGVAICCPPNPESGVP